MEEQELLDDIINILSIKKKKKIETNVEEKKEEKEEYEQENDLMNKLKYTDPNKIDSDDEEEIEEKKLTFADSESDHDHDSESNHDSEQNQEDPDQNIKSIEPEKVDYEIPEQLLDEDIIGIDLGTTNTCVSIWRDGCAIIIPDEFGNKLIPSYVAYTGRSRYVGYDAKKQKDINIKNVFYEVKRLIGKKIDDRYVQKEKELLSYDLTCDENKNILLKPDLVDKLFTPEEISAAILSKAKNVASDFLKKKITKCVITTPAHFNDGQRQATKDAAQIAGLECIRIINEPTAAALAYGLLERTKTSKCKSKTILVYDFGGGTLDVSVLSIDNGIFTVLASTGNMRLGGSDFDTCLIEYSIKRFAKMNKEFELESLQAVSLQKLRTSCENAKQLLSTVQKLTLQLRIFMGIKIYVTK